MALSPSGRQAEEVLEHLGDRWRLHRILEHPIDQGPCCVRGAWCYGSPKLGEELGGNKVF